jgi:hypothetical protein
MNAASKEETTMSSMIYEKTSVPGLTPWQQGRAPAGVIGQNPGSVNPHAANGPAGGYVPQTTITERAGSMGKPSLAGDASLRR